MNVPVVEIYNNIHVVRDDLITGGTKSRYLIELFNSHDEIVYASPAYGGAQVALAYCAKLKGKKATIFVAQRKQLHKRTLQAKELGANIIEIPYGYLNVVQKRAKDYCIDTGAKYMEFGANTEETINKISEIASAIINEYGEFDEVWCACGSGTLLSGLMNGIKSKEYYGVQVGKNVEVDGATIIKHDLSFEKECKIKTPFPSCPNYDKKAWEICSKESKGKVLFWNVMG